MKNRIILAIVLLCCSVCFRAQTPQTELPVGQSKYVILVTIDGMRPEFATDSLLPSPFLKRMRRDGIFVERIKGVPPTATYPSHTTIVTGARPSEHHIYYNRPFLHNEDVPRISYWWADSIKAKTVWQSVKEAGMKTASLFWPVSTGSRWIDYNIPEFWSLDMTTPNQLHYIKPWCTPAGIMDELEQKAVGELNHTTFWAGNMQRDAREAYMANYLLNTYQPRLMTVHLITTDYSQHATGTKSEWTMETIASADNAVGLMLENLKITNRQDSTTLIVCGDHGFTDYDWQLNPNVLLVRAGLLSEKTGGDWKACFHAGGACSFLYLRDKDDAATVKRVKELLESVPADIRSRFRIVEHDEILRIGADPEVQLIVEPIKGVTVGDTRTGDLLIERHGGDHGYLSGIDPTCLIVYGAAVEHPATFAQMSQTEIAALVCRILGIKR